MKRIAIGVALGVLLGLPALADNGAVAKVVEIKKAQDKGATQDLQYTRDAKGPYSAFVNMDSMVKDTYQTNDNTVAALEFIVGGRVGINKGSKITITSEHTASGDTHRVKIDKGGMWAKFDHSKLAENKAKVEIQTNGGVMGIKGTEFVVDAQENGNTQVSLLEGSIEVSDPQGKPIGTMQPGDQWTLALAQAPVRKHYEPDQLREDIRNSPQWNTAMVALAVVSSYAGVPYAGGFAYAAMTCDFENDPVGSAARIVNSLPVDTGPAGGILGTMGAFGVGRKSKEHQKPDFPTNVQPDNSKGGSTSGPVVLRWDPVPDAKAYGVLISPSEDFRVLEWSSKVTQNQAPYPAAGQPLKPGRHYWRVVPLDDEDKPLEHFRGSQTYFDLK